MDSSHGEENTDPIVNVTCKNKLFYDPGANVIPYRHDRIVLG